MLPRVLSLLLFVSVTAGCASRGAVDDPVVRSFTWFSYVGGEDIKAVCAPGASDRYRFVYNAVWDEQVRTYDVMGSATGQGAIARARVFGEFDLRNFALNSPQSVWQGASSRASLTEDAFDTLRRIVVESPFEGPTPDGKFLRSDEFYWAVSACRGGRFHFNAWTGDMAGFDKLPFFDLLLPLDGTNVAVNPPRKLYLGPFRNTPQRFRTAGSATQYFQLQVGDNGLRLGPTLF